MTTERRFARIQLSKEVRVSGPMGKGFAMLKDMSLGGAAFFVKFDVGKVGDSIELQLPFENEAGLPLMGEVVRITETAEERLVVMKFFRAANSAMFENQKRLDHQNDRSDDKRTFSRVANRILIHYGTAAELTAMLENISMGGFALTVDYPLTLQKDLEVDIPHPVTRKILTLEGRPVNQEEILVRGKRCFRVGFEFKYLSAEQRTALQKFLKDLLSLSGEVSKTFPK